MQLIISKSLEFNKKGNHILINYDISTMYDKKWRWIVAIKSNTNVFTWLNFLNNRNKIEKYAFENMIPVNKILLQ